jgi:hypothetical protein
VDVGQGAGEDGGLLGMLGQVLEDRHAEDALGAGLPGPHRVEQLPNRPPGEAAVDDRPIADGAWDIGPQRRAERCQLEGVVLVFQEYTEAGKRAQDAVQRGCVDTACLRKLDAAARTARKAVRNAEFGDDVQGLREQVA